MNGAIDLVIVGGGLGGLTAAALAARAGLEVVVVEKATALGGRAATTEQRGFSVNLGAHALYRSGPACAVLDELGVAYPGRVPPASGGFALAGGALHTLPTGFLSLVSTDVCGVSAKIELARVLATLPRIDAKALDRVTVSAWLERTLRSAEARALLAMFLRVATYAADFERMSAGAAVAQLQQAFQHNVLYLDGGWRTLVTGLRAVAAAAGASFRTATKATAIDIDDGAVVGVRLEDGGAIAARAVILAATPQVAATLVPTSEALAGYARTLIPVRTACLDVTLGALPDPRALVAFGVDRPLYASVHSAVARLAPAGGAVVHLMSYAPSGDARADEAELVDLLSRLQPGWRETLVEKRFLPSMVACSALVTAESGGLSGRPGPEVPGASGLYLAGDWVGPTGLLADAVFASARAAARLVTTRATVASAA